MPDAPAPRSVLVAGVGNVLRGDDGFGVRALERLRAGPLGSDARVRFWESGIAGVGLVHELMAGFEALLVLDGLERGSDPGKVFVLEPDLEHYRNDRSSPVDIHEANPERVLHLAAAMNALPERVWIVGAQVGSCDEITTELSADVQASLEPACREAERLVTEFLTSAEVHAEVHAKTHV